MRHLLLSWRVRLALWTFVIAALFILLTQLTHPGMRVSLEPILAAGEQPRDRAVWVLDITSPSSPKTDWERLVLGEGWRKAPDASLPSGAAAIASDRVQTPLVYTSDDNSIEFAFARGPEFGRVRITVGRSASELDLQAGELTLFKQSVARPWFYRATTASGADLVRWGVLTLLLWAGLFALVGAITRPQRVAAVVRRALGVAAQATAGPTPVAQAAEVAASDLVISVRGVGKMYRIYDQPIDRLKQMLWRGRRQYGREFWAIRAVSFEVRRGETMGIIGRNGSGKSTLLQMIAGTLAPSEGEVRVNGRVAALLELGSGFNPEFTGRENVFLNGAVLGLTYEEMAARLDAIIAFADIGPFIDQPVKTYSSGMMVRLAFAVQASIEPDVLIVDEALAVGDVFFQQKCYRHLEKLRAQGTAVLLVSHGMGDIKQFCQRALLLNYGTVLFLGESADAVAHYLLLEQPVMPPSRTANGIDLPQLALDTQASDFFWPERSAFLNIDHLPQVSNGMARCTAVAVCDANGQPCHAFQQGEMVSFFYEFEILSDIETPLCGIEIHTDKGITVHGKNSLQYDSVGSLPPRVPSGARLRCRQDVTLAIAVGEYTYEVGMGAITHEDYELRGVYSTTSLYPRIMRICHINNVNRLLVTERVASELTAHQSRLMHWGLADLPGSCRIQTFMPVNAVVTEQGTV